MKIAILLPYKENFSPEYPGAVSIFLDSVIRQSKYKKDITVYGNTNYKKKYKSIKYTNIEISKKILGLGSQTNKYINEFIKIENKTRSDIVEIHNRPLYVQLLPFNKTKKILYFHNDPLTMNGSKSNNERHGRHREGEKSTLTGFHSCHRPRIPFGQIRVKTTKRAC